MKSITNYSKKYQHSEDYFQWPDCLSFMIKKHYKKKRKEENIAVVAFVAFIVILLTLIKISVFYVG